MDIDTLWDFADPASSADRFRSAIQSNPTLKGELLTQVARTQGLQRKFDEARETLKVAESFIDPGSRVEVRMLLESGRVENSSDNKAGAMPYFLRAYELAQTLGEDNLAVDAAHMIAIAEEPENQLKWNMLALELAQASDDPKARNWQASLFNNIGWTLHDSGDLNGALEMFQRAVPLREAMGNPETLKIAKWCVGRCLRSLKRYDEAMQIQRALESEGHGNYVYEEIAELLNIADDAQAKRYFKMAFDDLSQDPWLVANESERLERLQRLGGA